MAHKKGSGSTRNGRDSNAQRLGINKYGGEIVKIGQIVVRQRGTRFKAGNHIGVGKDHTLYALVDGKIEFRTIKNNQKKINIIPETIL